MPDRASEAAAINGEDNWIARLLAENVPYEFVAQIDLVEAAVAGGATFGLPVEGRLFFFVDSAVLMTSQMASVDACRVIYDLSPSDALQPLAFPAKFDDMETWWRTVDPSEIARLNEMAETLEGLGQSEAAAAMREVARASSDSDPTNTKPFVYPSRAMKLTPLRVLPQRGAVEVQRDDALRALAEGDEAFDLYSLLTGNDIGPFSADPHDMTATQSWSMQEARRNRFMGPPGAEQDDPRYAAIPASEVAPYPWDAKALAAMTGKAEQWCLLLQVSVSDLSQQQTEGTIYILVSRDDLAKRDFTRASAVYQQT